MLLENMAVPGSEWEDKAAILEKEAEQERRAFQTVCVRNKDLEVASGRNEMQVKEMRTEVCEKALTLTSATSAL